MAPRGLRNPGAASFQSCSSMIIGDFDPISVWPVCVRLFARLCPFALARVFVVSCILWISLNSSSRLSSSSRTLLPFHSFPASPYVSWCVLVGGDEPQESHQVTNPPAGDGANNGGNSGAVVAVCWPARQVSNMGARF